MQTLERLEGTDRLPPIPEDWTAPKKRSTLRIVLAAIAAVLVIVLIAGLAITIANKTSDLEASQTQVAGLQDQVSGLEADLGNAEASVASLEGTVSDQDTQLASCYRANSLSVKADKAFHDAVGHIMGAAFGSNYAFNEALARYRTASRQWAVAANACEPGGGYSFG